MPDNTQNNKQSLEEFKVILDEIKTLVDSNQTDLILDKYYSPNIVQMEAGDKSVCTDLETYRAGRKYFLDNFVVKFNKMTRLFQHIAQSADVNYDFVVVEAWEIDWNLNYGEGEYNEVHKQLSIHYWKNGKVVKESYNYPMLSD